MSTATELRAIARKLPRDLPPLRPVILTPWSNTATTIEYRVNVPESCAGTMLGVRFPRGWPHKGAKLLSVQWEGGESVVSGECPLRSARKLKFWSRGGESLLVIVAPPPDREPAQLAKDRELRPYSLLVLPDLSGRTALKKGWEQ